MEEEGQCFSEGFRTLWRRLGILERWYELAVRPDEEECYPEDGDLLKLEVDNCPELLRRCTLVRNLLNAKYLPYIEGQFENDLVPLESTIPNAGLGLFYKPSASKSIREGETICYYQGHMHNYTSAKHIADRSYLMVVQGNLLVDPGPMLHVKARYINDPLNESFINCKFIPLHFCSAVVATRDISPNEELFVEYGDAYWSQHKTSGRSKTNKS